MTEDQPRPGPSKREQARQSGYFASRRVELTERQRRLLIMRPGVDLDPSWDHARRVRALRRAIEAHEAVLRDLRDELAEEEGKTE